MAETENAAKRTREAPKGPVKPEPAPSEAEQDSEARARQLVGLIQAESAAATPPEEGNGHLTGLQRSPNGNGNGNGNEHRAVRAADLRTLQRLAGNAAVSDLMVPPAGVALQRAPIEQAPPKPTGPPPPEHKKRVEPADRKAVKGEITQAVKAWMAASPEKAGAEGAEGEADTENVPTEDAKGTTGGPSPVAEAGETRALTVLDAPPADAADPGANAGDETSALGGEAQEGTPRGPGETDGGAPPDETSPRNVRPESGAGSEASRAEPATAGTRRQPANATRALTSAGSDQAARERQQVPSSATRAADEASPTPRPATTSPTPTNPSEAHGSPVAQAPRATAAAVPPAHAASSAPTSASAGAAFEPGRSTARAGSAPDSPRQTAQGAASVPPNGPGPDVSDTGPSPTATSPRRARAATDTATGADATLGPASAGPVVDERPRPTQTRTTPGSPPNATTTVPATGAREAAGDAAFARADSQARQAAAEGEAPARETTATGPREMAERERFDDHEDGDRGSLAQREGRGPAGAAAAPGSPEVYQRVSPQAPQGGGGGPRSGGDSRKGKEALAAWQGAAGGAVGSVEPADMSATEGAKDAVTEGAKSITNTRESSKPDYASEAKKVVPPTPEPPEREKMMDFTAPRGAITSIRKVGETRLQSRTLKEAPAPPALPPYVTAESFVPPDMTTDLAELEKLAAEATGEEKIELDKKASELRAKIQAIKDAKGVASGGEEIPIEGEAAASTEPTEADEDRAVVAAALSELAGKQDDVVKEVVTKARTKVDPGNLSDAAKAAIDTHRSSIVSELATELQGIASAAGIVDKDLDAKITAGKIKAENEGAKAKQETDSAATEGKDELKAQGKKETGEQKQAAAAVKEDAQAKVKAIEGGPEPDDIEAKVNEYLGKTITTGNKAKTAIASAVKKMTTKLDDKAKTKKSFYSKTGMTRSQAVRDYWKTELPDPEDKQEAYRKGEEAAVPTMAWMRTGKKGTDSEIGLIKNAVAAEHKSLDALVDSTVDSARDTIRDWGAEQEGTTRSWWEELLDDFMDWMDGVGTSAEGWEAQQNAETRDTILSDAKAIDAIVEAKKEDIDKVKDEQLEGMDSERRAIVEEYLAMGGSNSIQLVVMLTQHDITKRRIGEAVDDVDQKIMKEWAWSDVDVICKSRNSDWPGAAALATKILAGTGTTKVDKQKVFEGLAGAKSALERKALEGAFAYLAPEGSSGNLDEVLESRLSFDDEDRAQALRAGKTDEADAAAIEAALSLTSDNFAPDTESITKVLRGKSPAEIDAIKRAYKEKYGDDLDEVLGDTWFYDAEESDMVEALAKGDTDAADAAEVQDALKNLGTDEDQYNKVFDNIRSEVQAQALKEGMSPAEVEYEIKRRTQAVSDAYEKKYGQSLMDAVDEDFDGTEQQLAEAYLSGDADKIDATKILDERYSFNSDDDALEATVRNQKTKAENYYKQYYASKQAQLRERHDAGLISKETYRAEMAKVVQEQKDNQKQQIDDMTVENTKKLRTTYGDVSGGRNLDADIYAVSQGASNEELTALLAANGVLSEADELHYALAGAGTDEEMVRKLLYGRKPGEVQKLKEEYEKKHGPDSFERDIQADMDWGRDDEQILLMLEHDTSTPEGKLAYLKAAAELERSGLLYDDDDDPVGTDKSIALLEKQLEEYRRLQDDPNASDAQKLAAKQLLDMQMSGSESSLKEFGELKDAEIDEWVDRVKMGLVAIPGFQFLLLDDALLAGPMKMVLGGGTADTGQLLVEMGMSVIDIALTVVAIASGGTAAPATVALSTLIKQGAYREVAKRIVMELGKQALESMAMAALELSLTEKAWDSHDSVDVLAEQAMTDYVVGLVVGGVIDVGTGALSKNVRIDADGRIVADVDGTKVDADGGRADGDGGRVDGDDPKADLDDRLPDVDDTGTPRTDETGDSSRTDVDDTGTTRADEGGGGTKADEGGAGTSRTDEGGGGKRSDVDDAGGGGSTKADDSGAGDGGKKGGGDDAGGGGGKGDGPAKPDSEAAIAARAGMDPKTVDYLKDFSDQFGVRLQFRPTTTAAPGQIAGGAKAKAEIAKMKTAKAEDALLTDLLDLDGADFGKVVLFEPHLPKFRPEGDPRRKAYFDLDEAGRKAVDKRYEQRLAEWDDLHPDKNPYFKEGSGLDGGPALKMDGPFVQVQGIEGDYSFMTGDHDLFDVSWANKNKPMSKDDYDAIIASLRHAGVNVEHGAHVTWKRDRPKDFNPADPPKGVGKEKARKNQEAYDKIIADHVSGKEKLIEFGPDGVRETTPDPELHEKVEADTTPHPAHEGEIEKVAPEDVFDVAEADTGDLSAKSQAEHAAAVNPDPATIQTSSTPIDRTEGNKVAAGTIDVGSMGSRPDDPKSLGVFHHDFDGTPGVMKVFWADDPFHMRNFAWELSAARAAHETGYVRFFGEFDAAHAVGDDLVPARAIGYGFQPGKSLDKLDELVDAGDVDAYSRIKPHTVDQVKDFSRRMAERGYVLTGDFQYLVDIDGNVRPMDLEAFRPLPPPGPARDELLQKAAERLDHEIGRLKDMMQPQPGPGGPTGAPGVHGAGEPDSPSDGGTSGSGTPVETAESGDTGTSDSAEFEAQQTGVWERPETPEDSAEFDPDKTQEMPAVSQDARSHEVPDELDATEPGSRTSTQTRASDAEATPHPAHAGEIEQIAPEQVFDAAKADAGSLSARAQAEHAAAREPSTTLQETSTPINRTMANKVAVGTRDVGSMGVGQGSIGVFRHDFDGTPGVMKVFSAQLGSHQRKFARELSAGRAAGETGYVGFLGEFDAAHATGDNLVPARAIGYRWQPGESLDRLDSLRQGGDAGAYSRIKTHTIDQVKDFARRMADQGYVLTDDFQYLVDIDGNVRPMDLDVFAPLPPPGATRDRLLEQAADILSDDIDRLRRMMNEAAEPAPAGGGRGPAIETAQSMTETSAEVDVPSRADQVERPDDTVEDRADEPARPMPRPDRSAPAAGPSVDPRVREVPSALRGDGAADPRAHEVPDGLSGDEGAVVEDWAEAETEIIELPGNQTPSAGPAADPRVREVPPELDGDDQLPDLTPHLEPVGASEPNPNALPHDQLPLQEPTSDLGREHDTTRGYESLSPEDKARRRSREWDNDELRRLGVSHVMQLPGASKFDADANRAMFERRARLDMNREIALLFNKRTGQYAIVQGDARSVAAGGKGPSLVAGDTQWQAQGWVFLAHTHPVSKGPRQTSEANRWPSGPDWRLLVKQAERFPGRQQSEVRFFAKNESGGTSHRMETTEFIFDPDPDVDRPYLVRQPTGHTETFATIEEYQTFAIERLKVEFEIPQDFPGP